MENDDFIKSAKLSKLSDSIATIIYDKVRNVVIQQIENKYPIPCLILHHKNHDFEEYVWHWFLLIGYKEYDDNIMVKAVTYGNYEWLDLKELWNTGHEKKGGLILFD